MRIGRDEVLVREARISRDAVDRAGMDANAMLAAGASMSEEVISRLILLQSASFLDSARDVYLDHLVFDRYGLVRKPAASGLVSLSFSTTAPVPGAFTVPAYTRVGTLDGTEYVTVAAGTFSGGSTGPVLVAAKSKLAGRTQQVRAATLTTLLDTIPGAPGDLAVTNPLASSGAADAEGDESLRARARAFFTTARRATLTALEQGALAVAGVAKAKAFEVLDALGRPAKWVELVVADSYTDYLADLTGSSPAYAEQSRLLAQVVFQGLQDVRACGIYVNVVVARVVLQPVRLNLSFQAGVNVDAVARRARATLAAAINSLDPGQTFVRSTLNAVLRQIPGLAYTGSEIASPTGDIIPTPLQVIRSPLALVTTSNTTGEAMSDPANADAYGG